MDQKEFDQLLERYLDGDITEKERAIIDHWYQSIEHTSPHLTAVERDVIKTRLKSSLNDFKKKTRSGLQTQGKTHAKVVPLWNGTALQIAASIIFILAVTSLFFLNNEYYKKSDRSVLGDNAVEWQEVINTDQQPRLVALQDGSHVTLEPGGLLEYPVQFDSANRTVRLKKGKAFFDIQRDEKRPFYVYSYDVVTRVLGTSFIIDSNQQGHVTVDVKTGMVSVSAHQAKHQDVKTDEVILIPNQRAAYDPQVNKIVRTLVEKPQLLITSEEVKTMVFEKASIATVFKAIEKAYRVKIEFDAEQFSRCELTTYLIADEDLYTRLKIICQAINASYKVEDVTIVISGRGC